MYHACETRAVYEGDPFRAGPTVKVVSSKVGARHSRKVRFWSFLVLGVIWSAVLIAYWLPADDYEDYSHKLDAFDIIVMVIAAVPGLALIGASVHAGLALFNPLVEVSVSEAIQLGTSFQFQWRLRGRTDKLDRLVVKFEGLEEVHKEGAEQRFEQHVFHTETIINARGREAVEGETSVEVPGTGLPSFAGTRHRVVWRFTVEGVISRWPNIVDEFVVSVNPRKRGMS
jgi:hypothetical protein